MDRIKDSGWDYAELRRFERHKDDMMARGSKWIRRLNRHLDQDSLDDTVDAIMTATKEAEAAPLFYGLCVVLARLIQDSPDPQGLYTAAATIISRLIQNAQMPEDEHGPGDHDTRQ